MRKKKLSGILCILCLLGLLLCGCTYSLPKFYQSNIGQDIKDAESQQDEVDTDALDNTVVILEKEEAEEDADVAQKLPDESLAAVQKNLGSGDVGNYAYGQLDKEEQLIYSEILGILQNFSELVQVSTIDTDLIDHAFNCVMLDHPEIFYVSGYSITKYTRGDVTEKITLSGSYTMTASEAEKEMLAVDAYVNECMAGVPANADEYEKVKYVYEYLIQHTEYDLNAPQNQNILSVCENGRSVCQGYAKTTQYILNKMNVFCILVEGNIIGREAHVWNLVRINENYYYVDTTWGDASYNLLTEGKESSMQAPEINYDYLCVPERMIKKTHIIRETVALPTCTSMQDNYYVHEGIYFESPDEQQLRNVFSRAYEQGKESVTLKSSDATVYEQLHQYLILEEHIFDYLQGGSSVSYVEIPEQQSLLVYLQ